MIKLDILAIAAHPDDVELSCAGTISYQISKNRKVGVLDLTRGELGTRGTAEQRDEEAAVSAKILGLSVRENLAYADGFFQNDREHLVGIIKVIRKYRPEIVLCNAVEDRHPDHRNGGELASRACFLSGLRKIETGQEAWRPAFVYHYIQDRYIKPDFVVDVTDFWNKKIESIKAFKSQFHDPNSSEPETHISSAGFFDFVEARSLEMGHSIGVKHGEGFTKERQLGVKDLFDLI